MIYIWLVALSLALIYTIFQVFNLLDLVGKLQDIIEELQEIINKKAESINKTLDETSDLLHSILDKSEEEESNGNK